MPVNITSAAGIISLLEETDDRLVVYALKQLNSLVDMFWAEIADSITIIEMLYENEQFKDRQLAALVASKVYYHLGSFDNALQYALGADKLFNVDESTEYVETIISKCIDHYTKLQMENFQVKNLSEMKDIDPRLENIVNRMFQRCLDDKKFKQAIGLSIETCRLDILEKSILTATNVPDTISYAFKVTLSLIQNRKFRNEILNLLVEIYSNLANPDYVNVVQCLIYLDRPEQVANILENLVRSNNVLMAFQIGLDLYENATQQFLLKVRNLLEALIVTSQPMDIGEGESKQEEPKPKVNQELKSHIDKLLTILNGEITINTNMQFLIKNNHSDLLILKTIKDAVRNSICHTSTVICNSLMHCGTTSDQFLRDNLEWLARATNWAKFTATSSLGVIHKGHEKEALNLMSAYLPKDTGNSFPYSDGGGLYALGLIHANHGDSIVEYLFTQLKAASTEPVKHGACLGIGLAAMGTSRSDIYEELKNNLYKDDAVIGEAAGIAMGLVMLGSNSSSAIQDMLAYAQETQHEKILRGLAIGISLCMYGRLEEAKTLIETLINDKDPILRRSGMYTIAMAYCGTGNSEAIRRLLHVAVSDVNDDVRRAAVEALGFLLFRTPEQCPSMVSLLAESYNPHVRYGAAMALGIACAGTGNREALAVLEPMLNDAVNYVRQGVLIAMSLICIQHTESTCPKVKMLRETLLKIVTDKHDDVIAKFGAIIAQGILDAGGRNMSVSLQTRNGQTDMSSVVGLLVFTQFWYWFPLAHFLSLAFQPTSLIGLNQDLKMPKIEFLSNAQPSVFGYPAPMEEKKADKKEKVEKAVLSTTSKKHRRDLDKKVDKGEEKMDVDEKSKGEETEKKEKEKEPDFEILQNPARVIKPQLRVISLKNSRYQPLKEVSSGGFIILRDTQSNQPENLVELVKAGGPVKEEEQSEPEPPEPFEWIED
ncbi:26S proteasome non-ATPase regulatory subunit 1 [Brachionus plicatilis]|uniref:26S proteasome non-ATPase regulatory subunit 1 n=1 Tax=Brachionus plicatilis TaxID=10195 RepID=A0A3M7RYF5_BRAPC|nr:26S proteasome non-ATPase regulatory subunit 1 [Brachionus plicatilis]